VHVTDLVVAGGHTRDGAAPVDVVVDGGIVVDVVPEGTAPTADRVVDAAGCLVLPAFAEAHCHLDKTLFGRPWVSHLAGDSLASRISHDRDRRAELGIPDPVAMRSLVDAMVSFGTTAIRTHTDVDPDVGLRGVEAVAELALRAAGRVDIEQVAFPQHGLLSLPGTADLLDEAMTTGASVVGGLDPGAEGDAAAYLDVVFGIAERHGAGVDLHLHTHGPDGLEELRMLAERTVALGMQGRVVASHCYAFGEADESASLRLVDLLASSGVGVVTAAPYSFPVPPLRLLAEAGVMTGIGHDGIRDLWGPYGTGDLLERARHVAYRSGFRRDEDISLVLTAATVGGRSLLGRPPHGPVVGAVADLVVLPATNAAEAVVLCPPRSAVVRAGRVTGSW
jgi:cytosine deaminase